MTQNQNAAGVHQHLMGTTAADPGTMGEEPVVEQRSLSMAAEYMAKNGPTHPQHPRPVKTMTRAEFEAQKREEAQVEQATADDRMAHLEKMIMQVGMAVQNLAQRTLPGPQAPRNLPVIDVEPTPDLKYHPASPPTEGGPPPSVQEVSSPSPPPDLKLVEAPVEVEPEPIQQPTSKQEGRRQKLLSGTIKYLATTDMHKRIRTYIGGINKNLHYHEWPPELQKNFDARFSQILNDGAFVSNCIDRILSFKTGHMIVPHAAAKFVAACAGYGALMTIKL